MGWKFFRSINFAPIRINFSKSGIGWSIGGKGFRVGVDSKGKKYNNVSLPGTGISKKTYFENPSSNQPSQKSKNIFFIVVVLGIVFLIKTFFKN